MFVFMKLALIGDIHGNDLALSAVLMAASASKVDKLLVTGDLVGYYFAPLRVLELLSEWDRDIVRGNHEEMLSAALNCSAYLETLDARYGVGIRVAIEQLSSKQLKELCDLPHPLELKIDGVSILLCHGSPWSLDHYIYPDAPPTHMARCAHEGRDLVVMGHTHYPMLKMIGNTVLVNPGSVGQPRDGKSGAAWAIFDTDDRRLELRREIYDSSDLIRECIFRHPELPYLSKFLKTHE